jgi:Vanillate O-demethylase oxygenase C-terminal domain
MSTTANSGNGTPAPTSSRAPARFEPGSFALRDTWLPLIHTARVRRRPVRRAMHGQPVIFTRDHSGRVKATKHAPGEGGLNGTDGEFTKEGEYPVVERYGYAWVWYGNPDSASDELVPRVPHIPEEGLPRWFQQDVVFDCTYELVCENLLDLTHADFLHSALTGDALSEDDEIAVESTSETVTMTRTAHGRPIPKAQRRLAGDAKTQNLRAVTLTHVRSGVCLLHGDFNPGMDIRMLHPVNPESNTRCRTPVTFNPKEMPLLGRLAFPRSAHIVGRQDNWALRSQNAAYLRPRQLSDLSSRFDKADLRYRKVYQQLIGRQREGDYSYLADGDPGRDVREELGLNGRI